MKGIKTADGWVLETEPVPAEKLNEVIEDLERHGFRVISIMKDGDTLIIRTKTVRKRRRW